MASCWEIAAHSANDMFFKYKYLIVNLVFFTSVFGVGFIYFIIWQVMKYREICIKYIVFSFNFEDTISSMTSYVVI